MALHDGVGLHHEHQALVHGLSRQVTHRSVIDFSLRLQLHCDR
jgi:hypothetical protein